jgi:membrane carboxypeptidase/penicillin-binding protein
MTGSVVALPIWAPTMAEAVRGPESYFQRPDGIVEGLICQDSGQRPAPACQRIRMEVFIEGMEPTRTCEIHQPSASNASGQATDFQSLDAQSSRQDEFDQDGGG